MVMENLDVTMWQSGVGFHFHVPSCQSGSVRYSCDAFIDVSCTVPLSCAVGTHKCM